RVVPVRAGRLAHAHAARRREGLRRVAGELEAVRIGADIELRPLAGLGNLAVGGLIIGTEQAHLRVGPGAGLLIWTTRRLVPVDRPFGERVGVQMLLAL